MDTDLAQKMIRQADADGLPPDHELRVAAMAFETACVGYFSSDQSVSVGKFMGCWAKARRIWCNYTGSPLV